MAKSKIDARHRIKINQCIANSIEVNLKREKESVASTCKIKQWLNKNRVSYWFQTDVRYWVIKA